MSTTRRRLPPVRPAAPATVPAPRRRRRATWLVIAALPLALLAWVLTSSSLLAVSSVRVVGVARLSAAEVVTTAAVRPGTPLARVDLAAVRARVARLGPVATVRVVRAWPGTLRIRVTERLPVASVQQPDGAWVLVDATGARFAPSAVAPAGIAQLRVSADPDAAVAAVQVLAELPGALRDQVGVAEASSAASVRLLLRDGRAVIWGQPGDAASSPARKAAVAQALLARPGKTIDVTSPDLAVVR